MNLQSIYRNPSLSLIVLILLLCTNLHGQGKWTKASSDGFTPRSGLASCVIGDKIYVLGGVSGLMPNILYLNTLEVYDPASNTWNTPVTTGSFSPRGWFTANVVDGKIYVIGGFDANLNSVSSEVQVFDPANNSWNTLSTTGFFSPRFDHTASVINGKIYIFGGADGNYLISTVDIFDPSTNNWNQADATGSFISRRGATSVTLEGKIYIIGGYSDHDLNAFDIFDPVNNSWSTPSTIGKFSASSNATACVLGGKVYVMGGTYGYTYVTKFKLFDPPTDSVNLVSTIGSLTPRAWLTSSVVGNRIYVMGGYNQDSSLNTNEVFTLTQSDEVKNDPAAHEINIFPNPTIGIVSVSGNTSNFSEVSVLNVLGENVMNILHPEGNNFTLDLSSLTSGIYNIRINIHNSVLMRKIVKE